MSDTLVIYKSKYGSTKQYAEWIAADLNADVYDPSRFSPRDLDRYATVIYCGGLYANSIRGVRFIARNKNRLRGKKIVIVACGLSYPHFEESVARVQRGLESRLPQALHENSRLFMVRGSITYSRLKFFERFILRMLETALRKKNPERLTLEEQEMLGVLGSDFSFVDRASVQPIVEYCKAK
ncbi:MAG: flavodoxin domain-containing protein [Treponema sp.]|nr:flavodoxin domain-containing protein [Treponema sp.]